jgi:hypothetical protein
MSCSYDLHCIDCDAGFGVDWNHGDNELARLWSVREALAKLAAVDLGGVEVRHEYRDGHIALGFFATHKDHNVRIRDEYGRYVGDCREYVKCGECGTTGPCRQLHGHEGDHSRRSGA